MIQKPNVGAKKIINDSCDRTKMANNYSHTSSKTHSKPTTIGYAVVTSGIKIKFRDVSTSVAFSLFFTISLLAQTTTTSNGVSTVTYNGSGTQTWTAPSCVTSATLQCWGAGGGGGSNNGGGGGGGAYSSSILTITSGSTYTLNVGTGGSGGGGATCSGTSPCAAGGLGGDTWFSLNGSIPTSTATGVLAKGGSGSNCSQNSTTYSTVAGGQSSSGYGTTNTYNGGSGGSACVSCGVNGTSSGGGGGAAAGSLGNGASGSNGGANVGGIGATGTGGGGNGGTGGIPSNCGSSGVIPGGGGGGGGYNTNPANGGYGATGQVLILYSTPTTINSSNPAYPATTICSGTTQNSIYEFDLVSSISNTFTGFTFTTASGYLASDVTKFQLWYNTTDAFSGATQVGSNITTSLGPGAHSFTIGSPPSLTANTQYFFFITADVAASPTNNDNITVSAITTSNITMGSGCVTGSTSAGGIQDIATSLASAKAATVGPNTICNTETLTLTGASFGGSATSAAWSVNFSTPSSSPTLSSTAQTTNPAGVTFTPQAAFTGTVVLLLTTNGCSASATRSIYVKSCGSTTYTSSSTWTAPCGISSVTVQCWGGGGGGASNNGGGGGGGAYSSSTLAVTSGSTYTLNVGSAGSAGGGTCSGTSPCAAGGLGGDTWFSLNGSIPTSTATGVLAKGGSGSNCSQNSTTYSTVAGGQSSSGYGTTNTYNGGSGGSACVSCGVNGTSSGGGGGAAAGSLGNGANGSIGGSNVGGTGATGTGGGGNGGTGGAPNNCGSSGVIPGGGGGGGGYGNTPSYGGYGAAGQVIITQSVTHPTATISAPSAAVTVCQGSVVNFTGSVSAGATLIWSTVDGTSSGLSSTSATSMTYTTTAADASYGTIHIILTASTSCDNTAALLAITVLPTTSTLSTWIGTTSTNWFTTTNWCGSLPTSTISAIISPMPNMPAIGATGAITNSLTINSGATLTMASTNTLGVYGYWINNGTFTPTSSNISFLGAADQYITGSGTQTFYDLTINNSGATGSNLITLSQPVTVTDKLALTAGILATSTANTLTLTSTSTSATNGGSAGSFVNGPITWSLSGSANTYVFPTGAGTTNYARVAISGVTAASALFTCQYFHTKPSPDGTSSLSTTVTHTLVTLSGIEYWTVTPSVSSSAAVTLYWESATAHGINNCADIVVAHYNNSSLFGNTPSNKWENTNGAGAATTTGSCSGASAGTVKGGTISTFSPFTFGSTVGSGQNPLPIGLLYFNAVYNGENVNLSWATATETNNDYFTIERSLDGIHYVVVSTVPSQALNGNSISELIYNYTDPNSTTGVYYYRLKQTDYNGSSKYSNVQEITIGGSIAFSFEIAPNPNNGKQMMLFISDPLSNQTITMTIHDVLGKEILTQTYTTGQMGNSSFPVYLKETLSSGVYIVSVTVDNQPAVSKRLVVNN